MGTGDLRQDGGVGRYSYVAILAFVMAGCLWLEVALRTRVFRRWRRLLLSILPAVVVLSDADTMIAGRDLSSVITHRVPLARFDDALGVLRGTADCGKVLVTMGDDA